MRKLTKAAGLLFLAASSVYSDGVLRAAGVNPTKSTNGPTNIRPLDDASAANPTKGAASPSNGFTVAPATQPTDGAKPSTQPIASAPAVKPIKEGDVAVKDVGTVEIHVNDAS